MSRSVACSVVLLILCAGCSRKSPARDASEVKQDPHVTAALSNSSDKPPTSLASLREAAEKGGALAQRELATRFLFGKGVPTDPREAVIWAKKAAYNGDPTAMLWTGRAALNEPAGRIEAAAWFLTAGKSNNAAIRQDVAGEIEALGLTPVEHTQAVSRATELEKTISRNPQ